MATHQGLLLAWRRAGKPKIKVAWADLMMFVPLSSLQRVQKRNELGGKLICLTLRESGYYNLNVYSLTHL